MKKFKLFIDESGREHQTHSSKFYILLGCIIEAPNQHTLEVRANQIKYRYWKRTDIVFHINEIIKDRGDFAIFKNKPDLKQEFLGDLINLINGAPIKVTCCIVDKEKVFGYKVPWKHTTLIRKTADSILLDFLRYIYGLKEAASGVVVHEASGYEKDAEYLKVFNKVVTPGWTQKHPEFQRIREHFTSITFATKLNHDVECEFADILSSAALTKYRVNRGLSVLDKNSFEAKLLAVLERKLLLPTPSTNKTVSYDFKGNLVGYNELPTQSSKGAQKKRTA